MCKSCYTRIVRHNSVCHFFTPAVFFHRVTILFRFTKYENKNTKSAPLPWEPCRGANAQSEGNGTTERKTESRAQSDSCVAFDSSPVDIDSVEMLPALYDLGDVGELYTATIPAEWSWSWSNCRRDKWQNWVCVKIHNYQKQNHRPWLSDSQTSGQLFKAQK